jgi:hypothetical protein
MTEFEQDKITAVHKYLAIGFPELSIECACDDDHTEPKFSVEESDKKYVVKIMKRYWDRCDANTLFRHLKRLDVVNALRKNPETNVIVSQSIDLGLEPKSESFQ